jgi:hypothetical protein
VQSGGPASAGDEFIASSAKAMKDAINTSDTFLMAVKLSNYCFKIVSEH